MIGIVGKSTDSPNDRCLHFEIGDIGVSVRSEVPALLEDLTALYPGRRPSAPAPDRTIHMEVREARRSTLGCRRYRVYGDGEQIGAEHQHQELLPFVEWGINWRVIATRAEYLQVHAATMVHSGRGFLFAGGSGSGKSTLVAGLLARGWRYLCDEFALIDPGTLHLHPFPKAVCIKAGSFDIVEYLKLPLARRRYYIKGLKGRVGYINPRDVGSDIVGGPSPVRFVIFPKYIAGGKPDLYPISRARAAFALSGCALNRNAFGNRAISILANVVRGAECFSLETGPIDKTCDLVESLLVGVRPGPGNSSTGPIARLATNKLRGKPMNAHKHGSRMLLLGILVLIASGAWISGQLLKRHADLWSTGGPGRGAPASNVEGGLFERVCRATESLGLDCTAADKSGWAELSIPVPIASRDLSVHVRKVVVPVAFLGLAYFVFLGTWFVFVGPPRPSGASRPLTSTIKDGQSAVDVESWHRIPLAVGWVGAAVSVLYLVVMIADIAPACGWCEAAHVVNLLMVLAIRRLYRQSCRCWIGPPKADLRSRFALFHRKRSWLAWLLTWRRPSSARLGMPPTTVSTVPESRLAVHAVVFALILIGSLWLYRHQQLAMGSRLRALVPYQQMVSTLRADPEFLLREHYAQPLHRIPALSDDPAAESRPRLVVFTDFQCGACYCNAMQLREQVLPAFDGRLTVDVRHYPLCDRCNSAVTGRTHPNTCEAAYAAEAAGLQGGAEAFHRMHDRLFENRKKLGTEIYRELAVRIGLDAERFLRDFEGDAVRRIVQQDIELAHELGVDGAPTIFLNGRRISAFGRDNPVFWRAVADDWSSMRGRTHVAEGR